MFNHRFDGHLVRKGDSGYEERRLAAVWNARKPDRHPDAILLAHSDDDVAHAVRLAAEAGIPISIRSGGHSWIGGGVREGGLLIDLSELQGIDVDADAKVIAVRPAMRSRQIEDAARAAGLYFPTGHAPTVGVGGFLLGGGYGWNSRTWGPACLSILAIDVVLADGQLVHADEESHPDLLWAARGAGPGFFGVVTRFYLRLHPRYSRLRRSAYVFPRALRDEVLAWSYGVLPEVPRAVELSAKVGFVDGIDEQVTTLTAAAFDTPGQGAPASGDLLDIVRSCPFRGRALREVDGVEVELTDMYDVADSLNPSGWRWSVDGIWCDSPVEDVIREAAPIFDGLPTRKSFVLWMLWGGYPTTERAAWSAQAQLYLSPNAGWQDPADDLRCEDWAHASLTRIGHLSTGTQFSDANPADRPDPGLSDENAARLEELRKRFDPHGVFRTYLSPAESTTALGLSRTR